MKSRNMFMSLSLVTATGCMTAPAETPVEQSASLPQRVVMRTLAPAGIQTIPAVDHTRYPDSVGYVYEGALATVFWMQNDLAVSDANQLAQHLSVTMARGVDGEILSSRMQSITPLSSAEPTLAELTKHGTQSLRRMVEYASLTDQSSTALADSLGSYNAAPERHLAQVDKAALVDAALSSMVAVHPPTVVTGPAPPAQRVMGDGIYLADSIRAHERANLIKSIGQLGGAIADGDVPRYAVAYNDIYYAQHDLELSKTAVEALAVSHVEGVLVGQPLDKVITEHVDMSQVASHPFAPDALCLINQISLRSRNVAVSRSPLVAALLLISEDHRQGEQDEVVSATSVWAHIADATWLVQQYVRLKADGTTVQQANEMIDRIVASL